MDLLAKDLEQIKATLVDIEHLARQDTDKSALLERIIRSTEWPDAFFTLYADFYEVAANTSKARVRAKPTQLLLDIAEAFRTGDLNRLVV